MKTNKDEKDFASESEHDQQMLARANLKIQVTVEYEKERSKVGEYVFSYRINIQNQSTETLQIIARQWLIRDANDQVYEVKGLGIIGQQPILKPQQIHEYQSFAILKTQKGQMRGYFLCISENTELMIANIETFDLAPKYILH